MTEGPLGFMIAETVRSIVKKLSHKLKESGSSLSIHQYAILHFLNTGHEVIQQDIAEMTGKDKSAILRQIDILEKNKLIVRVADNTDRRKKNLIVTKKGAELHKELMKIEDELTKDLKAGITAGELKVFIDVLLRIKMNAMK
jgi:DNA-binding MarR family transcriptional regulator